MLTSRRLRRSVAFLAAAACGTILVAASRVQAADPLVILIVVDGLRPDAITPADMPNLDRLRREGVEYVASHSTIPTVTRVNGAVLSTGRWPNATGILSNSPFVAAVDSLRALSTSDPAQMRTLAVASGGRLVAPVTLAEYVERGGKRFVSVNAGSGGNALFSNPQVLQGKGTLINANLGETRGTLRIAYPDSIARLVEARVGLPPKDSAAPTLNALQSWSDRVIREVALPVLRPAVLATWTAEPDESQHRYGVGSPEARSALGNLDHDIGLLLRAIDSLGLRDRANIIVTSDHGFAHHDARIDVADSLVAAGFKSARGSADVVVTGDGQSVQLFVRGHDANVTHRIVTWLQGRAWTDAIFTAGAESRGTFSLSELHLDHATRAPDIFFTLPWSDATNRFEAPGSQTIAGGGRAGPLAGDASGHGGASPWVVHNTLILWGPAFRRSTVIRAPAGTVDITPTILDVVGIREASGLDGRSLREAFRDGPAPASVEFRTTTRTARAPGYEAFLQITEIVGRNGAWYVDKAWRSR